VLLAMIHPVPEKGGRGKKKTMDETSTLFSPKRLQLARTVLAQSPDLAQAVLAGSKSIDAAYEEATNAKQPLDAQVAGKVRRKVARSKKVAVLTAHSDCDPEAAKMTEGIELPMPDFDRLAKFKRRIVEREAVWVCEQLELAWSALRDRGR
jgi:hypothetical protein